MVLAVYRMIHHLPAHGQQYVLDSIGHIQTGDILVSKLGCLLAAGTTNVVEGSIEQARDDGHVTVPQ